MYRCSFKSYSYSRRVRIFFSTCSCWLCDWPASLKANKMCLRFKKPIKNQCFQLVYCPSSFGTQHKRGVFERATVSSSISEQGFCESILKKFALNFPWPLQEKNLDLPLKIACMYDSLPENVTNEDEIEYSEVFWRVLGNYFTLLLLNWENYKDFTKQAVTVFIFILLLAFNLEKNKRERSGFNCVVKRKQSH